MLAIAGVLAGASLAVGRVAMIRAAFLAVCGAVMAVRPELAQTAQTVAFIATLAAFAIDEARLAFGRGAPDAPRTEK